MSKSIMTQAINQVNIVGKLLDVSFGSGTTQDGRPYERANVTVRVNQSYDGVSEISDVSVSFFATEFTSTGKQSPAWRSLQDLKNMKTVQNVGIDAADTVRISGANLQENNFVSRNGQLINGWQIRGSFINKVNQSETAVFKTEIYIMDMFDEIDREGDPTGRLGIKAGIVQYNGKLDVLELIVEDPTKVDYIRRNWEVNTTIKAVGHIRVTSKEVTSSSNGGSWGEEIVETTTRTTRELVVTGGDDEPLDEEFAYDQNEIRKAFQTRKAYIEQLQVDAKNKASKAAAPVQTMTSANKYSWE